MPREARVADDRKDRIGGIRVRDAGALAGCCFCGFVVSVVVRDAVVVGPDWSCSKTSCCCAEAQSVVDLFGGRPAGSGRKERGVLLKAGGSPVYVAISLLLCDGGALRPLLIPCSRDGLFDG